MSSTAGHRIESARVRRAPRYGVFLVGGALLGVLVAVILTFAFGGGPIEPGAPAGDKSDYTGLTYSTPQVLGFLALIFAPIGLAVGGVVALILDRVVGRRTREVRIDRETVVEPHDAA